VYLVDPNNLALPSYGADVGEWFMEEYLNPEDKDLEYEDLKYESRRAQLNNKVTSAICSSRARSS
jgi:hypothetical protein